MQEERILQKALSGDSAAFEALIAPYENRIYQVCLRMMGKPEDALDMAQESLLRIYKSLKTFKHQAKLSTWIYRLTTNACLDELRRRKRMLPLGLHEDAGNVIDMAAGTPGPHEDYLRHEQTQAIRVALAQLSEDHRAIIILRDIQGLSYEEVSQVLSLNINTVRSRIFRARRELREKLNPNMDLFGAGSVNVSGAR